MLNLLHHLSLALDAILPNPDEPIPLDPNRPRPVLNSVLILLALTAILTLGLWSIPVIFILFAVRGSAT